jgi:hypothetical protein
MPQPLPGGLIPLLLHPDQLDLILEALGSHAGRLADEDGPADWRPFAKLQAELTPERTPA